MTIAENAERRSAEGKSVLITGCSSGIGWTTAVHLARNGLIVFATVRKEADAARLRRLGEPNLVPVCPLDLTLPEEIAGAVEFVERELGRRSPAELFALIHNAGGGQVAPVELMNIEAFGRELAARVRGSAALTQACLPMIRRAAGRILWITTPAAVPTPYVASIHACDFAVNCLARTLGIELKKWSIPSVMVRCGGIRTETGLRTTADVEATLAGVSPDGAALYREAMSVWAKSMVAFDRKRTDPEKVAETVLRALHARRPKPRYSVGYMSRAAAFLEALPPGMADWILKKRF